MRKVRCAFFFHDTDYYSGATRSLLDLIEEFIEEDTIDIIAVFPSTYGSAIDYLKERKVDIVCSHYYQIRYELSERKIEYIKKIPIRLARMVGSRIWIYLKTIPELRKQNPDIIYSNTSLILAGYWTAKKLQVPVIAHFREYGEEDHKIGVWIGRDTFYKISNQYDRIICISEALKRKYEKKINGDRIRVIYDDISKKYINWNEKDIKPDLKESFNILLAGNLIPGKGQLVVLRCLANYIKSNDDIIVYIAGNPSDRNYVEKINKLIKEYEIQNQIRFLGLVEDMNTLRKRMHIGIVLSEMEAFGRVTIEGMLSGMIMIASREGGSVELIEDGVNGFLAEKDGRDLEKIVAYIKNNYESLRDIQIQAFEFAVNFTKSRCSKKLLETMEEIVNK